MRRRLAPDTPLVHVPRICDDPQVQRYLEAEFLNFLSASPNLTADEMIDAACEAFGRPRCGTINFWVH
jgi:hypothetical protein